MTGAVPHPRSTALLGACAALALLAAACGEDSIELDGTAWADAEVVGYELAGTLEVAFADGSISLSGGCNTQNGSYELDGDLLTAGPLMSTLMACPDELMAQDAWIAALLAEGVRVEREGSTLTWSNDEVTITLQAA